MVAPKPPFIPSIQERSAAFETMELIRNIARNVHAVLSWRTAPTLMRMSSPSSSTVAASDSTSGRSVSVSHQRRRRRHRRRGRQGNALIGYAYKDITQGYLGRRSTRRDTAQTALIIILASMLLWYAPAPTATLHCSFGPSASSFLRWEACCIVCRRQSQSIFEKFQAAFLVVRASIDTVRGVARQVTAGDGGVRLELGGRRVQLARGMTLCAKATRWSWPERSLATSSASLPIGT